MVPDEMSKASFRIAYDGEALREHTMDVRDLAPAMLALGDLLQEANRVLNADDSTISLRVTPNVEEQCFDLGLELHQYWEQVKGLLVDDDVVAAAALINWTLLSAGGLVGIYKLLKGSVPKSTVEFEDEHGQRKVKYELEDGDEVLHEKTHKLYSNPKIKRHLSRILDPVINNPGIDKFSSYEVDDGARQEVSKSEAKEFQFATVPEEEPEPDEVGGWIEAILRVYSPVYDGKADRWRFWYGKEHHYMDVSESNIKDLVLQAGGALVDDKFRVRLQITQKENETGDIVNSYKVGEVLEFHRAHRQPDMFLEAVSAENENDDNDGDSSKEDSE
jgi:hypothetical protein